jgi:hypothetical protein
MIEAQLFRADGVVVVLPSVALTAVDFEQLAALVDPYIDANGELKGLMIVAERFPGWEASVRWWGTSGSCASTTGASAALPP